MKTLYLECSMGAAGDMLMAALSELLPVPEAFVEKMNALQLPGIRASREYKTSAGVRGAHMHIWIHGEEEVSEDVEHDHAHAHDHAEHDHDREHSHEHDHAEHEHDHAHEHTHTHDEHAHHHHHHHHSMEDIRTIVMGLPVSDRVKQDVLAVYGLIAEAESQAHGCPVEEIHFHEVGALDAIADVTGVCLLMEAIGADKIVCSPVHVGSGMVRCAHGIVPVPAPATATILRGIPCYGGTIRGELCTPTGAALLKHFVSSFGPMPVMTTEKIGIGLGSKEFPAANMLRAFLGESAAAQATVEELSCNLDDCTGEEIGFATELLLQNGALDVFTSSVQMKKSRPGILLTVVCKTGDAEKFAELMLRHTTTLGVRRKTCMRTTMHRRIETAETKYGPVRFKTAEGYGAKHCKAEFEDVARIAREQGLSYREVLQELTE